ncbi:unnamed protein product [Phytophthora fragariaefolia]|uniref:Unnamed protein product n=1 Tax=Phytophthora fragariaefolia TaxID=1490495 RepID=A0A9W6Y043_9STRA|nr:unnamed protein product [Phytophthora fragariaefolia]
MWAADKKCFTRDDFFGGMGTPHTFDPEEDARLFEQQTFAFKNDLIVLYTFCCPVENEKPTLGIVVTSRRVFRNAVLAIEGQPDGIVGVTDGTYRLHRGGWVVVDFGTCCTRHTRNTYAQCFIPFAYLFVRTENIACYKMFFHVVQQGVLEFFWTPLEVNVGSLDDSDSIKAAILQKWPDIVLTSCWPHVLRGTYKADKLSKLICREMYKKRIRPHLGMLHSCRTIKQFQAVADMVITDWRSHGEHEYVAGFEEEYLTDSWCRWFATAADLPGVMPNQNHTEAHHRSIKASAIISKRASTEVVLNVSFPRILVQAGELSGLSDKLRPYCSGPVAGELITRAEILCNNANLKQLTESEVCLSAVRLVPALWHWPALSHILGSGRCAFPTYRVASHHHSDCLLFTKKLQK